MIIDSIKISMGQSLPILELNNYIEAEVADLSNRFPQTGRIFFSLESSDHGAVTAKICVKDSSKKVFVSAVGSDAKAALEKAFGCLETTES
jgi:hypothetical protein